MEPCHQPSTAGADSCSHSQASAEQLPRVPQGIVPDVPVVLTDRVKGTSRRSPSREGSPSRTRRLSSYTARREKPEHARRPSGPNATAQEAVTTMDQKHYGSTLDSLFEEIGALQEMNERLAKRILVEQLSVGFARSGVAAT